MDAAAIQALQEQIQQLQQQLQAVQAQQMQGGQQQQPPPQPAAVVFAREPAQANQAGLLNFSDRNDIEFHKNGSKTLPGDAYDGTKMHVWLSKVETRAISLGMQRILTVNNELLTRRYGEITREQVRVAAMTYQIAQGRDAQNASILFNLLDASINDTVRARLKTLHSGRPRTHSRYCSKRQRRCVLSESYHRSHVHEHPIDRRRSTLRAVLVGLVHGEAPKERHRQIQRVRQRSAARARRLWSDYQRPGNELVQGILQVPR
jgi:hypothetical protein